MAHTIEFTQEHITPRSLTKELGIGVVEILEKLNAAKVKGVFSDELSSTSILPWNAVKKLCSDMGFEPVDVWKEKPSVKITTEEREVLARSVDFHKAYATMLKEHTARVDPKAADQLFKHHMEEATAIETLLERSKTKTRPLGPEIDI